MLAQAAIAALLLGVVSVVLKDVRRAGVITALLLVLLFNLKSLTAGMESVVASTHASVAPLTLAAIVLALFVAAIFFVIRSRSDYLMFTKVMNGVTLLLLIFNIAPIVSYELAAGARYHQVASQVSQDGGNIEIKIPDDGSTGSPDVYYVILDCMGSSDVMSAIYGYDNSDHMKFLEKNNFYVAKQSHSNYDRTMLSLSSSLNLTHLTRLQEILGAQDNSPRACYEMMTNNRLMSQFKGAGYQIVNVSSGFTPTFFLPNADINIGEFMGNRLYLAILEQSVLGLLEKDYQFLGTLGRKTKTYFFDHFDEIDAIRGPKFVFAHILVPHPPFLFDERGGGLPMPETGMSEAYSKDKYVAQSKFMEAQVRKLIDKLMKKKREVVMIVQGDHGPQFTPLPDDSHPSLTYLKERFGILNAYYGPPRFRESLYATITPVNSFRLLLKQQFLSDMKPLADESYYCERNRPFNFKKVTAELVDSRAASETKAAPGAVEAGGESVAPASGLPSPEGTALEVNKPRAATPEASTKSKPSSAPTSTKHASKRQKTSSTKSTRKRRHRR